MAYNATALVRLAALKALAAKTKAEIDNINTDVSKAIKSLGVSGNTVSFYTSADKSGVDGRAAAHSNDPVGLEFQHGLGTAHDGLDGRIGLDALK